MKYIALRNANLLLTRISGLLFLSLSLSLSYSAKAGLRQRHGFFIPEFKVVFASFPPRDAIAVQSGKKRKEENRKNNEHLVPRSFTSNNNEQIEIPSKHEDKLDRIVR